MMMTDRFGRTINYMRISITDRCNLRCRYCMPDAVKSVREPLTLSEITFICEQAVMLGIDRIKITGGEPLVRPDCAALIAQLKRIQGMHQVTLTTNGILFEAQLNALLTAGLDAVNISLDTMEREQYRAITGTDALDRVLSSIHAAAGKLPVRINCVVLRGMNDDAPVHLVNLARNLPVDVRFIELMPFGAGKALHSIPNTEILGKIEKHFGKTLPDQIIHGNGPAVYRRLSGFTGSIGFISAMHGKFCVDCNRLRLMSGGELKPCLCYGEVIPLKEILRSDSPDKGARIREKILEAVHLKPEMHCFESRTEITENRLMSEIGG